jgi:hypothetical protein
MLTYIGRHSLLMIASRLNASHVWPSSLIEMLAVVPAITCILVWCLADGASVSRACSRIQNDQSSSGIKLSNWLRGSNSEAGGVGS